MRSRALAWLLAGLVPAVAHAQSVPLAEWVKSAEVLRADLAVYAAADQSAARRGTLIRGARLPIVARVEGSGCGDHRFVQIGEQAFVCERDLHMSAEPPDAPAPALPKLVAAEEGVSAGKTGAADVDLSAKLTAAADAVASLPSDRADDDLPYEYLQAARDGTRAYASLDDYDTDEYATVFAKGFAVAVAQRVRDRGVGFVRTLSGYYVREADLRPVHASRFAGVAIDDGDLSHIAWVIQDGAQILPDPASAGAATRATRLQLVHLAGEDNGRLRLQQGGSIDARAVVRPELREPAADLASDERWLDVDLTRQVLVAYEGRKPVFATVISSGRNLPATRTPLGAFRIWVKLRGSDMRESDLPAFEQSYAIEQVPWVQYFKDGYGLHAAFWHDRFGEVHSRGCINLSPHDARWLFGFTRPDLPAGWAAVRSVESQVGTLIVIRTSARAVEEKVGLHGGGETGR